MAHKRAGWLHNPCLLRGRQRLRAEGQNERWPRSGPAGYITPAAGGVPKASQLGVESQVAHKWARWLHNRGRLACPQRFTEGGRITSGPQLGRLPT